MPQISIDTVAQQSGLTATAVEQLAVDSQLQVQTDANGDKLVDAAAILSLIVADVRSHGTKAQADLEALERVLRVEKKGRADTIIAGIAVAIALIAVAIAYFQLEQATTAVQAGNQYEVQSDILELLFKIEMTEEPDSLATQLEALDARVAAAVDLYEIDALNKNNWSRLLGHLCPVDRRAQPVQAATIKACDDYEELWSD